MLSWSQVPVSQVLTVDVEVKMAFPTSKMEMPVGPALAGCTDEMTLGWVIHGGIAEEMGLTDRADPGEGKQILPFLTSPNIK